MDFVSNSPMVEMAEMAVKVAVEEVATPPEPNARHEFPYSYVFPQKSTAMATIMHGLAARNCRNIVGDVPYNKYGSPNHRMVPIGEIFADNFCVSVATPAEFVSGKGKGKKNSLIGAQNCYISAFLKDVAGLRTFNCTGIGIYKGSGGAFLQRFKVSTSSEPLEKVEKAVRKLVEKKPSFEGAGEISLHDIDITRDFAGCFDREALQERLLEKFGFRIEDAGNAKRRTQRYRDANGIILEAIPNPPNRERETAYESHPDDDAPTILRNVHEVGRNCLTFLRKRADGDGSLRSKVYNKFAQVLESSSVRSTKGMHLWNWCNDKKWRFRETVARCLELGAGLTRIETSFPHLPDEWEIERAFELWLNYLAPEVCYDTSIEQQWRSFMEHVDPKENLIVYSPQTKDVLAAYWLNQHTLKVGGISRKNCDATDLAWMLSELTFDGPVRVLYVDYDRESGTVSCGGKTFVKRPRTIGTSDIRTRLADSKNIFKSCTDESPLQPEQVGLPPANGIHFYVATARACATSARRFDIFEIYDCWLPNIVRQSILDRAQRPIHADLRRRLEQNEWFVECQKALHHQNLHDRWCAQLLNAQGEKIYDALFCKRAQKIGKSDVGKRFEVFGISELVDNGGPYYVLATQDGPYRGDPTVVRRLIPYLLPHLTSHQQNNRTVRFYKAGAPIFAFEITGREYDANRHPRAVARHTMLAPIDVPKFDELEVSTFEGSKKALTNINSLPSGTKIDVVGICSVKIRGRETFVLKSRNGASYLANYFAARDLHGRLAADKSIFTLICGPTKTTPTKHRECTVTIV